MWLILVKLPLPINLSMIHMDKIPDDPFRTINYHPLDISGHDGLDEQDIGWRNGWCIPIPIKIQVLGPYPPFFGIIVSNSERRHSQMSGVIKFSDTAIWRMTPRSKIQRQMAIQDTY
jgi:hypothetical protein